MRSLFLSETFLSDKARLARVKSPAELVAGTAKLAGSHSFPDWTTVNLAMDANFMGQEILNPPTVEGWHTGTEWIDTGNLVERINSAALEIGDIQHPGVKSIINKVRAHGGVCTAQDLVDLSLDSMCQFEISDSTRNSLLKYADMKGPLYFDRQDQIACSEQRVGEMLQLIVSTREYQLA